MILWRTDDNYAKISLIIWSTVKVSWVRRCSRNDHSSAFIFDRIFFILAGNEDIYNISNAFEIGQIGLKSVDLAALERLEKSSEKML